jgi:two-component system, chemotaxis family, protein-glutamate methylesterase/glutaminase
MKQPIRLVTRAVSAGGIPALREVFSALPADYPAAVAIVQHRSDRQPDLLAKVLSRDSRLSVNPVKAGERLQPGRVYLAPARRHLVIQGNGTFGTIAGPKIHHLHSSANPLFETAAKALGPGVVAVVLTGGDSDAISHPSNQLDVSPLLADSVGQSLGLDAARSVEIRR